MQVTHAIVDQNSTELWAWLELPEGGKLRINIPKTSGGALVFDAARVADANDD